MAHRQKEEANFFFLIVSLLKKNALSLSLMGFLQLVKYSNKPNYNDLGFVSKNWVNQIGKAKRRVEKWVKGAVRK